jgi:acid phosphatase
LVLLASPGCGGGSQSTAPLTSNKSIPQFSHVFVLVEENHSFADVIGNSNMPYLNELASANSLATQYYGETHPSLPNYFELTIGEGASITGTSGDFFSGTVTQDNVVRALTNAGKTWKAYEESLPSAGYLGADSAPTYDIIIRLYTFRMYNRAQRQRKHCSL